MEKKTSYLGGDDLQVLERLKNITYYTLSQFLLKKKKGNII